MWGGRTLRPLVGIVPWDAGMDQHDDFADPDLPPWQLPTLRTIAILALAVFLGVGAMLVWFWFRGPSARLRLLIPRRER